MCKLTIRACEESRNLRLTERVGQRIMELEAHIASLHEFGKCILIDSLLNAAFVNSVIVFSAFPGLTVALRLTVF